jgi:hypothetical protein
VKAQDWLRRVFGKVGLRLAACGPLQETVVNLHSSSQSGGRHDEF